VNFLRAQEQRTLAPSSPRVSPQRLRSERSLDWLNLFVANIQTGFGPFLVVYLTSQGWTQTAIGIALSVGTLTAMASQVPAGALVDAMPGKSLVAGFSVLAFTASALMLALQPTPLFVYLAEMLHGFSSCTLGPAVAAMSIGLAGRRAERRFALNARYASIGNGIGAALMGGASYAWSDQAVFFLTAALTLPALAALVPLRRLDGAWSADELECEGEATGPGWRSLFHILLDRRLLLFAACAALFQLGNTALLPLASSELTKQAQSAGSLFIAACIVLPQAIVALLSPAAGRLARRRGRRITMVLCFTMLAVRGALFAVIVDPIPLVLVQALDGIAGACFGVLVPLVISDIAGRSGHFNLCFGAVGFAIGMGGTASTAMAGWVADRFGEPTAFALLGAIGLAAALLAWSAMPETRPGRSRSSG
jgi:MFS family permease